MIRPQYVPITCKSYNTTKAPLNPHMRWWPIVTHSVPKTTLSPITSNRLAPFSRRGNKQMSPTIDNPGKAQDLGIHSDVIMCQVELAQSRLHLGQFHGSQLWEPGCSWNCQQGLGEQFSLSSLPYISWIYSNLRRFLVLVLELTFEGKRTLTNGDINFPLSDLKMEKAAAASGYFSAILCREQLCCAAVGLNNHHNHHHQQHHQRWCVANSCPNHSTFGDTAWNIIEISMQVPCLVETFEG